MSEKTAPAGGDVDLFGDPWSPPRDPRGRKSHKRSAQVAESVAVFRATGATEEATASAVGLSVPTLRKYYLRELTEGPALAQALVDRTMYRKAMTGNVSAAKYVRDRFKDGDASLAAQRMKAKAEAATTSDAPPAEKLGKKAERLAVAEGLASEGKFAPPPAPGSLKLVASRP